VSFIVIVAPIGARWAHEAQAALADHRVVIARLFNPSTLGSLVNAGGVRAIAIDGALARAHPTALRALAGTRVVAIDTWSDVALRELLGDPP
jgi:hypothetical protein